MQFIDNSDKIKSLLEEALFNGLTRAANIIETETKANGGKAAKSWKANVSRETMTATIDNPDQKNAIIDEFGKGEYATGEKGSIAPVRPLERALIGKRNQIEKAVADEIKNSLG